MCFLCTSCSSTKQYTRPDLDNLTPQEQEMYDKFKAEIEGTLTEEEKAQIIDNHHYTMAIARDIAKKYIMSDKEEYESLTIDNLGDFLRNEEKFTRIDLSADDVYVKSMLINTDKNQFKLYDKNEDKVEDFEYNHIGHFVRNLGPWNSEEQKLIAIDETTPQRVGTIVELYRELETNDFHIAIQTYYGYNNIASIIVPANLTTDKTLSFTFEDDGFNHSGSGTLEYISETSMKLTLNTNKPDEEFGLYKGTINLVKNKM
jgi:hypothetical protein